jgi:hypothetical protein
VVATPVVVIMFLLRIKKEHPHLSRQTQQIRLRDINKTCLSTIRPQKKQALEVLKALHVLQPKLKERVVQFLLRAAL